MESDKFKVSYSGPCTVDYIKDVLSNLSNHYEDYCFSDTQLRILEKNCAENKISFMYEKMNTSDGHFYGYKLTPLTPHKTAVTSESVFIDKKHINNYKDEWKIRIIVPKWQKRL